MFLKIKQSFTERKIFNELEKQIKKSKKFEFSVGNDKNDEICNLDTIDIRFRTYYSLLEVSDKTGKMILSLGCQCSDIDETSHMRHRCFYSLRDVALKRAEVKNESKETKKAVETVISEKQKYQIMLNEALQRIRGA